MPSIQSRLAPNRAIARYKRGPSPAPFSYFTITSVVVCPEATMAPTFAPICNVDVPAAALLATVTLST